MQIQINFLPPDLKKKAKERIKLDIPFVQIIGLFLGIFVLLQVLGLGYFMVLNNNLNQLKKQNAEISEQYKAIAIKKSQADEYEVKIKKLWDVFWARFRYCRLLNSIVDSVQRGMWLRFFYIKDVDAPNADGSGVEKRTALILEGTISAPGQETAYVGKFIKDIKEHPYLQKMFSNVGLSAMIKKQIRGSDVYEFTVICLFDKVYLPL